MNITFLDDGKIDPLPVGVRVSFYPLGADIIAANLVAQVALGVGGTASVALASGETYVALFAGYYAPSTPEIFQASSDGSDFSVMVQGFRSSELSTAGYASAQRQVWVRNWIGSRVKSSPVGDTIAYAFGSILGALDTQAQIVRAGERLETCNTLTLAARWVLDYCGKMLPPYMGETLPHYVARVEAILTNTDNTVASIQNVCDAWLVSNGDLPRSPHGLSVGETGSIGEDGGVGIKTVGQQSPAQDFNTTITPRWGQGVWGQGTFTEPPRPFEVESVGIAGGVGVSGGISLPVTSLSAPYIYVFDWDTDMANASVLNLPPCHFGVALLYKGTNNPMVATSPFSPDLDYLIGIAKPGSYLPYYATNNPPSA